MPSRRAVQTPATSLDCQGSECPHATYTHELKLRCKLQRVVLHALLGTGCLYANIECGLSAAYAYVAGMMAHSYGLGVK